VKDNNKTWRHDKKHVWNRRQGDKEPELGLNKKKKSQNIAYCIPFERKYIKTKKHSIIDINIT